MRIFWKDKEISCDEDVVEQLNIVRLPERERNEYNDILNFLNNPSNELNYYLIAKRFFNIKFTSDDLLEYLRYRDNKQYTKVVTIPVDKIRFNPFSSLCPNLIEKSAPLPIHKPNIIDVIKVINVKDDPTAASAVFPKNCPTIKVSAML